MIKNGAIVGVRMKLLKVHADDEDTVQEDVEKGCLMEVYKFNDTIMGDVKQSNYTIAYHGSIKAWHVHEFQDDLWFFTRGEAIVVLHDLRTDSQTFDLTEIIRAGAKERKTIFIPRGVAHGYKVVSKEPCELVYFVNQLYNPEDEGRRDPFDSEINFNWYSLK